jgi:hypothetical protein
MKLQKQHAIEDIAYIKKILEETQQKVVENGSMLILWGIIIVIGQTLTYTLIKLVESGKYVGDYCGVTVLWGVLFFAGWIVSFLKFRKQSNRKGSGSFVQRTFRSVWASSCIGIAIFLFTSLLTGNLDGNLINPIISVFIGGSYFICANLFEQFWFKILACGWWCGAIIMFVFPGLHSFLIFSILVVSFLIIPGIVLYRKSRVN